MHILLLHRFVDIIDSFNTDLQTALKLIMITLQAIYVLQVLTLREKIISH